MKLRPVLAAIVVFICACGSTPPSTFYALAAENGSVRPPPPPAPVVHTIRVRRPGIPGYLDRPEIVRNVRDYRLGMADTERWASPLDEMFGRVLAQDLEERLPGTTVFTDGGAISVDADATVEVDVRRFDADDGGDVVLIAEVALEKGAAHAPAGTRSVALKARPAAHTTAGLVRAMSDLLAQLADTVATLVREAPVPEDPTSRARQPTSGAR